MKQLILKKNFHLSVKAVNKLIRHSNLFLIGILLLNNFFQFAKLSSITFIIRRKILFYTTYKGKGVNIYISNPRSPKLSPKVPYYHFFIQFLFYYFLFLNILELGY